MSEKAPLSAFIDIDDEQPLPPLDRSRLQNYATCPAMARFIETGKVLSSSRAADIGNEVHAAFSEATDEYVTSDGILNPRDLVDVAMGRLLRARPDVQPDAIDAAKYSLWNWASILSDVHPSNVLRYDGGKGGRSGQLTHNVQWLGVAITSELDLLYSGPSKQVLHEIDYKSGYTSFSATAVAKSFQFQTHAYLVFHNYPEVSELEVSIWETRGKRPNPPVTFRREDLNQYEMRIMTAAQLWKQWHTTEPAECPAWPDAEKCGMCRAARFCPIQPPKSCVADPAGFVKTMHVLSEALGQMETDAALYVEQFGEIVTPEGICFGREKPTTRRPKATLYTTEKA